MTRAESLQIYRSWEALWEDNVPLDIPGLSAIIGYWYVRRRRCLPHDDDDAEVLVVRRTSARRWGSRRGKKKPSGPSGRAVRGQSMAGNLLSHDFSRTFSCPCRHGIIAELVSLLVSQACTR